MDTKLLLLDYIETGDKEGLKKLYLDGEITIEEYRNSTQMLEEQTVVSYDLTPEEYAAQFKRAKRYYNALIVFVCIDIIPLMWLALFFIYFPVVIYTWVFAFGKPILLPNDEAVAENNQLGKFIIMSWIPAIGIVADIAILVKVLHLKKMIKEDTQGYAAAYSKNQEMNKIEVTSEEV